MKMNCLLKDYPIGAILAGVYSAFSGVLGFAVAILGGALAGCVPEYNGWSAPYSFVACVSALATHVATPLGLLTASTATVVFVVALRSEMYRPLWLLALFMIEWVYAYSATNPQVTALLVLWNVAAILLPVGVAALIRQLSRPLALPRQDYVLPGSDREKRK